MVILHLDLLLRCLENAPTIISQMVVFHGRIRKKSQRIAMDSKKKLLQIPFLGTLSHLIRQYLQDFGRLGERNMQTHV